MSCGNCEKCGCSDRPDFDTRLKVAHVLADEVGKKVEQVFMTPEDRAVKQFLARPSPTPTICGCMGPRPLPGQENKPYEEAKRTPLCGCAMRWVEEVDGFYYRVLTDYEGRHTVTPLGPVGGPYLVDRYGRPV